MNLMDSFGDSGQLANAGMAIKRPFTQRERMEQALARHEAEVTKIRAALKLLDENPELDKLLNLMSTINC